MTQGHTEQLRGDHDAAEQELSQGTSRTGPGRSGPVRAHGGAPITQCPWGCSHHPGPLGVLPSPRAPGGQRLALRAWPRNGEPGSGERHLARSCGPPAGLGAGPGWVDFGPSAACTL